MRYTLYTFIIIVLCIKTTDDYSTLHTFINGIILHTQIGHTRNIYNKFRVQNELYLILFFLDARVLYRYTFVFCLEIKSFISIIF